LYNAMRMAFLYDYDPKEGKLMIVDRPPDTYVSRIFDHGGLFSPSSGHLSDLLARVRVQVERVRYKTCPDIALAIVEAISRLHVRSKDIVAVSATRSMWIRRAFGKRKWSFLPPPVLRVDPDAL